MFIALNEENERVSIDKADKEKHFSCPICGESVSVKAIDSLSVKAHFAHKRGTECFDTWKHDMSEWHYNWQCLFPEENREVVVEKDGVKHRADVLINNFVIEFQHSPITAEEIIERNNFYLNCGYTVIWVFDADGKIKNADLGGIEWKRARREFKIKTPERVLLFVDNISTNSLQQSDEILLLRGFHPKEINPCCTFPYHITKDNFLKQFGGNVQDNVLSIDDIFKEMQKNLKKVEQPKVKMVYCIPKRQNKRSFHF